MSRTMFALLVVYLAVSPLASAAETLMAEFEQTSFLFYPEVASGPASFEWRWQLTRTNAANTPIAQAWWTQSVTAASDGQTFDASPGLLTDLVTALAGATPDRLGWVPILVDPVTLENGVGLGGDWTSGNGATIYTAPDALTPTRWTRTVDYVSEPAVQGSIAGWRFGGTQTVRIWGRVVPEPGGFVLIAMALIHGVQVRKRAMIAERSSFSTSYSSFVSLTPSTVITFDSSSHSSGRST